MSWASTTGIKYSVMSNRAVHSSNCLRAGGPVWLTSSPRTDRAASVFRDHGDSPTDQRFPCGGVSTTAGPLMVCFTIGGIGFASGRKPARWEVGPEWAGWHTASVKDGRAALQPLPRQSAKSALREVDLIHESWRQRRIRRCPICSVEGTPADRQTRIFARLTGAIRFLNIAAALGHLCPWAISK